jgi:hypothetical protein
MIIFYDFLKLNKSLKAVKAVTRKSRYCDTEAKTGITKTDCTKSRETQGTKHIIMPSGFRLQASRMGLFYIRVNVHWQYHKVVAKLHFMA